MNTRQIKAKMETTVTQHDIDLQNVIIAERDKEMKKIYEEMLALQELTNQMAIIANQQGDTTDRIADNVISSNNSLKQGLAEIEKAEKAQNSSFCMIL